MKKDYYTLLNVSKEADAAEIKKAYRKLALEFHPDRNPSPEAAEKFREVSEAYSVLSEPEKRSLYDRFGHRGLEQQGFSGFSSNEDIFSGFQSIFEDFFGGGGQRGPAKGNDLEVRLSVEFRTAVLGGARTIEINRLDLCEHCHGSGAEKGTKPKTCETCHGRGKIGRSQGFFMIAQTCHRCQGSGVVIEKPCKPCRGQGLSPVAKEIEVKIPAGVDTGMRLRIAEEGEPSREGGRRGDLFVDIQVEADEVFERDGRDLFVKVLVPFTTAVFGGEVDIPLLEGSKKIEVSKGMQSPHIKIVPNEGVVDLRTKKRGQLVCELLVETPQNLSPKAKELIEQLRSEIESPSKTAPKGDKKKKKGIFF